MHIEINIEKIKIEDCELIGLVRKRLLNNKANDEYIVKDGNIIKETENRLDDRVRQEVVRKATAQEIAEAKKEEQAKKLLRKLEDLMQQTP